MATQAPLWLAIGVVILLTLWLRKKDDWIAKAGAATVEDIPPPGSSG
jgi:hypothetical protein